MKTINELDKFCNADTGEVDAVGIYTLRESAIEDVKELRKELSEWEEQTKYMDGDALRNAQEGIIRTKAKIDYIMEKFCLTEEDIKEDVK